MTEAPPTIPSDTGPRWRFFHGGMNTRKKCLLLVALAVLSVGPGLMAIRELVGPIFGYGTGCHSPELQADADIKSLRAALMMFHINAGRLPTESEGLDALVTRPSTLPPEGRWVQLILRIPKDPWGNPYLYQTWADSGMEHARISSTGADLLDPSDDIAETFSLSADHGK